MCVWSLSNQLVKADWEVKKCASNQGWSVCESLVNQSEVKADWRVKKCVRVIKCDLYVKFVRLISQSWLASEKVCASN